jgi:hypothetical protein
MATGVAWDGGRSVGGIRDAGGGVTGEEARIGEALVQSGASVLGFVVVGRMPLGSRMDWRRP